MRSLLYFISSVILLFLSLFILNAKGYFTTKHILVVSSYSKSKELETFLNNEFSKKTNIYNLNNSLLSASLDTSFSDIKSFKIHKNYLTKIVKVEVTLREPFAKVLGVNDYFVSKEGFIFKSSNIKEKDSVPLIKLPSFKIGSSVLDSYTIAFISALKPYPDIVLELSSNKLLVSFKDSSFPVLILSLQKTKELSKYNMVEKINYILGQNPSVYEDYKYIEVLNNKLVLKKSM